MNREKSEDFFFAEIVQETTTKERKTWGERNTGRTFCVGFFPFFLFHETFEQHNKKTDESGTQAERSETIRKRIHLYIYSRHFSRVKKNTRVYFTSLRAFCSKREICLSRTHNFCLLLPSIHKHLSKFVNLRKEHAEQFAHSFERSDMFDMFVRRELSARILFAFLFVFLFFSFHSKNSSLLLSGWCAI